MFIKKFRTVSIKMLLFCLVMLSTGAGCAGIFSVADQSDSHDQLQKQDYGAGMVKKTLVTDSGGVKGGTSSCFKKNCLYIDNLRHFSLNYPESWQVREGVLGTAVTFVTPFTSVKDSFAENVSVVTEDVASGTTVDAYYKNSEENIKKYFSDFKLLKSEPVMLGDFLGRMVTYSSVQGSVKLKTTQLFVINQSVAYVITVTNIQSDPTAFTKEMMAVAQSFHLVK